NALLATPQGQFTAGSDFRSIIWVGKDVIKSTRWGKWEWLGMNRRSWSSCTVLLLEILLGLPSFAYLRFMESLKELGWNQHSPLWSGFRMCWSICHGEKDSVHGP
ncbi:MAG: hypothetical protein VXZ38_00200, partial [Planctomycetota bacterium]|nr:hypothetical protein [Planctomycetota bacterium]